MVIDRYRKAKEFSLDSFAEQGFDVPDDPGIPVETQIDADATLEFLQDIPEKYREAVWLRGKYPWF